MLLPQHFEEKDFHLHVPLSCLELSLADYPPHCLCSNCFSQTNRTNTFQGRFFQDSLVLSLRLIMLCSSSFTLNTSDQLRSVLPELKEFRVSSRLLGVRPPLDLQSVFIRSLGRLLVLVGVATSTTESPDSCHYRSYCVAGIIFSKVGSLLLCPASG
jgi:hypothetical protein